MAQASFPSSSPPDENLAASLASMVQALDVAWVMLAAVLVLLMQAGFMFLEAGMVRSKNSVNVAQKNFLDLIASIVLFAAFGFSVAFGAGSGLVGWDERLFFIHDLSDWENVFFVFQVMFCGTAATIVSGAVAERMRLHAYVLSSVLVAALIYPVFVHWAWGNALFPNPGAFLANMGFIDFAGSTVVHSTGAWVSLAGCLILGPRIGKFTEQGKPIRISGHSAVLATAGTFLLFVGWLGFNGGSTLAATPSVGTIISNTILAAGTGGLIGYLAGLIMDDLVLPERPICGLLGGLVAVTAGCHVLDGAGAMLIGALGGLAAIYVNWLLEHRLKIDDAVGAIGVHGGAGIVGTLGLVFLAPPGNLPHPNLWAQFAVQSTGVLLNAVWAFGVGLAGFWLLRVVCGLRPSAYDEARGLNEAEHGTTLGVGHVETALGSLASGEAGLDLRLAINQGDDAEKLTIAFNEFMDRIEAAERARGKDREISRSNEEATRLATMADAAFEGICIVNGDQLTEANKALADLLQIPLDELRTAQLSDLVFSEHMRGLEQAALRGDGAPIQIEMRARDGGSVPAEVRTREVVFQGRAMRVYAIADLRERKAAEDRILFLAQHDTLTGLPNRAVFNRELQHATSKASASGLLAALLLVDLDKFKDVNDLYGHPSGDTVLQTTADRLRELIGQRGSVARLGGDEFAVLLRDLHFASECADLAQMIVECLCRPTRVADDREVRVGASVGIALLPRDGADQSAAFSSADLALYASKNRGRNTYSFFEPGMDAELRLRRAFEADLGHAIERGELSLEFQPRVSLSTAAVVGYEALLRWKHPTRGHVPPSEFIPIAEQSGHIVEIGGWVIREACRVAHERFPGTKVSVNVSAVQFRDPGFVEKLLAVLEENDFPPEYLELEITETVLMEDEGRAERSFSALKARGISLALDDFGTGYSSLSYLRSFSFDCIKMDRSFVQGLSTDASCRAIVDAVISLGKSLNLKIVAEGVEGVDDLEALQRCGCDEVQGYFTGRPAPEVALPLSLEAHVERALEQQVQTALLRYTA